MRHEHRRSAGLAGGRGFSQGQFFLRGPLAIARQSTRVFSWRIELERRGRLFSILAEKTNIIFTDERGENFFYFSGRRIACRDLARLSRLLMSFACLFLGELPDDDPRKHSVRVGAESCRLDFAGNFFLFFRTFRLVGVKRSSYFCEHNNVESRTGQRAGPSRTGRHKVPRAFFVLALIRATSDKGC